MRNLKKFLALVLSLMMVMSLMVTANASIPYTDKDNITSTYEDAVEVLNAIKVLQGYSDGTFNPGGNITRGQMAAIVYRIMTGDVDGEQVSIYADWNRFADVPANDWSAGYVNFCANAELIKGVGNGNFRPYKEVTGYQALAMVLRAIGYGEKQYNGVGEFEGSGWEIRTASRARFLGITTNIKEGTLAQPATREMVAEIVFRALQTDMVNYTILQDYQPQTLSKVGDTGHPFNNNLLYQTFGLVGKASDLYRDPYGRPYYAWTGPVSATNWNPASANSTGAVRLKIDALTTYHDEISECQLTKEINGDKSIAWSSITEYINGAKVIGRDQTLNDDGDKVISDGSMLDATHTTVNTIGAKGRTTEIYSYADPADGKTKWTFVYWDTLMGEITNVTNLTRDTANHVMHPATLTIEMNDGNDAENIKPVIVQYVSYTENFTNKVGDLILLSTYGMQEALAHNDGDQTAVELAKESKYQEVPVGSAVLVTTVTNDDGSTTYSYDYYRASTTKAVNDAILCAVPSLSKDFSTNGWDKTAADVNEYAGQAITLIGTPTPKTVTINGTVAASNTFGDAFNNKAGLICADGTYMANHVYFADTNDMTPLGNGTAGNNTRKTVPSDYFYRMENEMIAETWTLYLDGYNYVVGMTPSAVDTNVGVILTWDTVRVGAGKYVVEAEMLMSDNSRKTVRFLASNSTAEAQADSMGVYAYFDGIDKDLTDGKYGADVTETNLGQFSLVQIQSVNKDGQTYYVIVEDDTVGPRSTTQVDDDDQVLTGVANTLSDGTNTALVNDKTIFFVQEQEYRYNAGWGHNVGANLDVDYAVYTGFKNIPTIKTSDAGNISFQVLGNLQSGSKYAQYVAIEVQDPTEDYVITKQDTIVVDNSLLVVKPIATYADYSSYEVLRNGVKETLNVANINRVVGGVTTGLNQDVETAMLNNQLIYVTSSNSKGYATAIETIDALVAANNDLAKANVGKLADDTDWDDASFAASATIPAAKDVEYADGVLTIGTKTNGVYTAVDQYLTMAGTARVVIVNQDQGGEPYPGTLDSIWQYENWSNYTDHNFVYELDANGYVCVLYIVD